MGLLWKQLIPNIWPVLNDEGTDVTSTNVSLKHCVSKKGFKKCWCGRERGREGGREGKSENVFWSLSTVIYVTFIKLNIYVRVINLLFKRDKVSISPTVYEQLFCSCSLGLNGFVARKLAEELLVKCWWNWINIPRRVFFKCKC